MKMFKHAIVLVLFSITVLLFSCQENKTEQSGVNPKIQVSLTKMSQGYLPDYLSLTGKTIYLNKSSLMAPISGYIIKVNVQQGDHIKKGEVLFEMQSPEAYIMQQKGDASKNFGVVKIYAPSTGQLVNLNIVTKGVFADKGALMCVLLASNDLKVQVSVPFEDNKFAKIGKKCIVILPDNTEIPATFSKVLPQVDESSQTIKVLANLSSNKFIPENIIVKVLLEKSEEHQSQILPVQCLQTDALMTKYWIMKLINDSTAVQVAVEVGNQTHDQVEILSPEFNRNDLFISEGAYGLSDTVLVTKAH